MDELERITKDLTLFERSLVELDSVALTVEEETVVAHAKRYFTDTAYYLKKGDYFTAFGCINYAHGLVDSLRNVKGLIP
ncbi:MAG TPA: DUF357 domain-containing protein [Methanomicrobia archaeon]|nr:DUF357 domain-containing protein [Methanomicrobia archaeon]